MLASPATASREIQAESLRYFLQRTHRAHMGARLVSAIMFAGVSFVIVGPTALLILGLWLAGCAVAERHILIQVRGFEGELDRAARPRLAQISAKISIYAAVLSAIYVAPAFPLAFVGPAGAAFAIFLSVAVMMNALSQHVLTRWMILKTLPAAVAALMIAAYQLGLAMFSEHAAFFTAAMVIITMQAVSLAVAAAGSYRSLFEAKAEAVREAQARREADAANEAKSIFLAHMSHELRTPLNAIIGYSEILRENAVDDQRQTDIADTDKVLRASRHLLGLINDVLDVAKIEAGELTIQTAPVDAREIIRAALETVTPAMIAAGNRFEIALACDIGVIDTDAKRFEQCLLNLLSNAAKFTRDGVVGVTATRANGALEIAIADTGIGIAPERLAAIFEPFVQADRDTAVKFGGTGLGLALTRKLARLLGGDVSVTSTLGQGARFTLRVRAEPAAANVKLARAA